MRFTGVLILGLLFLIACCRELPEPPELEPEPPPGTLPPDGPSSGAGGAGGTGGQEDDYETCSPNTPNPLCCVRTIDRKHIYTVESPDINVLIPHFTYKLKTYCLDKNDVLLNGGCYVEWNENIVTPIDFVVNQSSFPINTDDLTKLSGWQCNARGSGELIAAAPLLKGVITCLHQPN